MANNEIDSRLTELVKELYTAKQAEEQAKAARVAIEERIAALVPTDENGSKTVDSGIMKVTVKRANTYKIDDAEQFAAHFPTLVKQIPAKWEIDVKAYEAARAADTPEWHDASAHVTVTPKKVSVTLKV